MHSLPFTEQSAIVRFLDHADHLIQRNIRAKQDLIELLEEQKQAIIHQAVTGQIDVRTGEPYPSYKSTGVKWLESIPEHWGVRRFKSVWLAVRRSTVPLVNAASSFSDGCTVPQTGQRISLKVFFDS